MSDQLITVGDQSVSIDLEDGDVIADVFVVARTVPMHNHDDRIAIAGGDSTSTLTGLALLRVAAQDVEDTVMGSLYEGDDDE